MYFESGKLNIWIFVVDSPLQRSHGLLGNNRLASYLIGDLQIQKHVLAASWQ